ncbi:hypothetical protein DEI81_08310 [Curtobacterium sp. MCBD17_013]|nr:hypothetical protein DEI86_15385 [Curtobacterium sp. MCBD17_028]PZF62953.1 hypothetical protein DEI81_08310 [Curtobacterium sp. MCBD17_013]
MAGRDTHRGLGAAPVSGRTVGLPARRRVVEVVVVAVVVGAAGWFFGLPVPQAVVVAAVITAVGLTWSAVRDDERLTWPAPPTDVVRGARRDVQALAWSLRSRGGVPERPVVRLRAAAGHLLLVHHGVDIDDPEARPAVERLLPPDVVRVLLSPRHPELDLATFSSLLIAVEALGEPSGRLP